MNVKNSVLDFVRYKQLNWYGHVEGMKEERDVHLREEIEVSLEKSGCTISEERGLEELDWIDKEEWSRAMRLSVQKDVYTLIIKIITHKHFSNTRRKECKVSIKLW